MNDERIPGEPPAQRLSREGYVRLSGGPRLYHERCGEPSHPSLLLIRPLGGDVGAWGPFRDHLARRFQVLAFDLPGTGRSSGAPWGITTRSMAEMCLELLDALEVPVTHVFGISLGGMVATWLAILGAERVGCVVLASTPRRGIELLGRGLLHHAELGRCWLGNAARTEACLSRQMLEDPEHPGGKRVEARILATRSSRRQLLKLMLAGARHNPRRALTQLHAPTLVLAGEHDQLVPASIQRRLARSLADAEFRVVEGAAHALTVEAARVTADRVIDFIEQRGG